jgi:hypothetical protein
MASETVAHSASVTVEFLDLIGTRKQVPSSICIFSTFRAEGKSHESGFSQILPKYPQKTKLWFSLR